MIRYVMTLVTVALNDRKGITAMEYGVLAVAVIGAIGVAATTLGNGIEALMVKVAADL